MTFSDLLPVNLDEALRLAVEDILEEGESLSTFVETAVRRAVEARRVRADFRLRGEQARQEHRRSGVSYSVEDVAARLQSRLDARRRQLGL